MAGRKSKYEEYVRPRLEDIKKWAESGATEKEISTALGIALSTFSDYKTKYSELTDALRTGRQKVVLDIKAALLRKALGFEYEEKRGVQKNGQTANVEIFKRYSPPDTTAAAMLLRNYDTEWKDKDTITNDMKQQEIDLRKQMAEFKEF